MPTLNWIGKDKVVNHHLDVPFRVLEEQYTYGDNADRNMIIHGDNLDALKALLPRFEGRVHLHRSALQHRQRGLGVQRQRQRSEDSQVAG